MLHTGDPSLYEKESNIGGAHMDTRPQHRPVHDPSVTFEEYHYYAQLSRSEEENLPDDDKEGGILSLIFPSKWDVGAKRLNNSNVKNIVGPSTSDRPVTSAITDQERTNASRALRTASRGAVFYLITTDIMGPFGLPYAIGTLGWG